MVCIVPVTVIMSRGGEVPMKNNTSDLACDFILGLEVLLTSYGMTINSLNIMPCRRHFCEEFSNLFDRDDVIPIPDEFRLRCVEFAK